MLSGRNDVNGGSFIVSRSFRNNACGPTRMQPRVLTDCALPPTLQTFEAVRQPDNQTLLTWSTANDPTLVYYLLEKSINGVHWTVLSRIPTNGAIGNRSYSTTDPVAAGYTYYRLRLVYHNGNYEYSPIRRVGTEADVSAGITLYPNPVLDNNVQFEYQAPADGQVLIRVFDAIGRKHAVMARNVSKGTNLFSLEMPYLRNGFHILQLTQENTARQVKFLKR
jgi:hypothetical protein